MLTWVQESVCVFPQDQQDPVWVPKHLVRKVCSEEHQDKGDHEATPGAGVPEPVDYDGEDGAEVGTAVSVP